MGQRKSIYNILFVITLGCFWGVKAQISPNVYHFKEEKTGAIIQHELKISDTYFIHTQYQNSPAKFISTVGGHYITENDTLKVKLEFNSNYLVDSITKLNIPYTFKKEQLVLYSPPAMIFEPAIMNVQDLDGPWLFATRGPDEGQERRGDKNSRKTLKFLMNGHFQWIAYNTETMKFHGTGGGSFTSKEGVYNEHIVYFSRDNSRVGASLQFSYELKNKDWHHKGKNSKGEPLYEIWEKRNK